MSTSKTNRSVTRGKTKTVGLIILIVVVLFLIGVIVYLVATRKPTEEIPSTQEEAKRNVVVTKDNFEEALGEMSSQPRVPLGYYTVTMNYDWHFASGDAISDNAYIENAATNTNPVYLDLFLAGDESEAIYASPVIPLGASLSEIKLDKELEPGKYDCIAVYHLVDENQNTVDTLRVTVTVSIDG